MEVPISQHFASATAPPQRPGHQLAALIFVGFSQNTDQNMNSASSDLPGFYYDTEKNRYFPIKGPIPGSRRMTAPASSSASTSAQTPAKVTNSCRRTSVRTSKMLQARELCGNLIPFNKGRCNFNEEFQKAQACHPVVWKYQETKELTDGALERIRMDVQTEGGQTDTDFVLAGGMNGSISIFEVGKVGQGLNYGMKCKAERVWPLSSKSQLEYSEVPGHIWKPAHTTPRMPSNISSIKMFGKQCPGTEDDSSCIQHMLISTLGAENSGGSLVVINLHELLNFDPNRTVLSQNIYEIATFNCTVWTTDCESDGSRAVIGTNLGAALVDLETGSASWLLRSKSDVLAQQLVHSGNAVLCGLRNGAIVTVDVRQKQGGFPVRPVRHRMRHSPLDNTRGITSIQRSKPSGTGNIHPSHTTKMPSSIASLVSLRFDDQYFLASSMDGTMKLYDQRLIQRGAVQSYEGLVNSHTRLQLGVDPSERFVMSGGEDCNLRLWSIKSGKLLFEDKFCNTIPSTVCWRRAERFKGDRDDRPNYEYLDSKSYGLGAWIGSQEGLFYMHWQV
ncbi:hypothetical protein ACFX2J_035920 [Malus domestica]